MPSADDGHALQIGDSSVPRFGRDREQTVAASALAWSTVAGISPRVASTPTARCPIGWTSSRR